MHRNGQSSVQYYRTIQIPRRSSLWNILSATMQTSFRRICKAPSTSLRLRQAVGSISWIRLFEIFSNLYVVRSNCLRPSNTHSTKEFAWASINESRVSTRLGHNVMLFTYVSIFYLPLAFCAVSYPSRLSRVSSYNVLTQLY